MFGVDVKDANVNFENMLARKEDIINQISRCKAFNATQSH